jgi:hypothetical protein
MTLAAITSREAVLKAIEEFDQLGREAFLQTYGFGYAKEYFLFYKNRFYDSKAIVGVAHKFQFPNQGHLPSDSFSGGQDTVVPKLNQLGFEVRIGLGLALYQTYSREDVHYYFSPDTQFTPQAGTWGLHGIVPIPNQPGHFVFFVTFGQKQGEHQFDEGITVDGVLSWQSQPSQTLHNKQIQQFIAHDELDKTIYLFLRTTSGLLYTYLGRLKYLNHDPEREEPVYFQWQILDWNIPDIVLQQMGLQLANVPITDEPSIPHGLASATPPPPQRSKTKTNRKGSRKPQVADYSVIDAKNRELGREGELFVLSYERERLISCGRPDLAELVRHIAADDDAAGYDIRSYMEDGSPLFIEVKTTRGPNTTDFFMSSNEVAFAGQHQGSYRLYRVYRFDSESQQGPHYEISGLLDEEFTLTPTHYRLTR